LYEEVQKLRNFWLNSAVVIGGEEVLTILMIVSGGRRWMDRKVGESCDSGDIWVSMVILLLI